MATSRLHELFEAGVSPWIDSVSREMLETGELARLMKEDAVVGVTSNPTIFQKALSTGDWYDEQLGELLKTEDDPTEIFLQLAMEDIRRACDLMQPGLGRRRRRRRLRLDRGRPDAGLRPRGDVRAGDPAARGGRQAEPVREDPGHRARPRRDRGLHRARARSINVTLIFSLERYAAVVEAYIRGLERLVAGGGDPTNVASVASFFVSRVDTEADRRLDEIGGQATRAAGEARDREREARVPPLAGGVRRPALGVPRRQGRDVAALPLGLDLDQEPGVPRRDLRRGADRAGDGEHDAGRDDRRLPGSRRGRGTRSPKASTRRRSCSSELGEAGVDYDDVVETLEAEGVQKFADSFDELLDGIRAKQAELAAGVTCDLSSGSGATTLALDRYRTRTAGSAGSTSSCGCSRTSASCPPSPRPRSSSSTMRAARDGRLVARARGAAADVQGRVVSRPRQHASRRRSAGRGRVSTSSGRSSSSPRSRARRSRRAPTSSTSGSCGGRGAQFAAITDPGSELEPRERARLPRRPSRASPRSAAATRPSRCSGWSRRR